MNIKVSTGLKSRTLEAFRYDTENINDLMEAVERGDADTIRSMIDDSIDRLQLEINQVLHPGEISIHNARIENLGDRYNVYSEYLEIINTILDEIDANMAMEREILKDGR